MQFTLQDIIQESEGVRTFILAPKDKIPSYQPGNFFMLSLPDEKGKRISRPYSAASHSSAPHLQFCIKLAGTFTHLLWKLEKSSELEVTGPYGLFLLSPSDAERVFIAGGAGISALRSMLLQTLKEAKPAHLFHSAKTKEELTYFSEMEALEKEHSPFKFHPAITQNPPPGWAGIGSRLSAETIKQQLGALENKTFYICGSRQMAKEITEGLLSHGVAREKIKSESWG